MLRVFSFSCSVILLGISGCGLGVCLNQAECPDGSWSSPVEVDELTFIDLMASTLHRDKTAAQKTLKEELAQGASSLPSGYRKVPKIGNDIIPIPGDDDGYLGGSVTYGGRPVTTCGTTQITVDERVADCASRNSGVATWDGSVKGNSGQGVWKLVTYNGTHEVWRDERTRLIWSDRLGIASWCQATGSSGGGPYGEADQDSICTSGTHQPVQATPESWCAEDPAFNTPGSYDSMKGGMRLTATATSPSIVWRVPTKWDFHQAEIDGIRFPLPNILFYYWSSTVSSFDRYYAWVFSGTGGDVFVGASRFDLGVASVRCVGR